VFPLSAVISRQSVSSHFVTRVCIKINYCKQGALQEIASRRVCNGRNNLEDHSRQSWTWVTFWATVCKTVRPMLSDGCLSCLFDCPICDVGVLWPNGWMDKDETWYEGRPRSWPLMGTQLLLPQMGTAPSFRRMSIVAKRSPISATAEHLFETQPNPWMDPTHLQL